MSKLYLLLLLLVGLMFSSYAQHNKTKLYDTAANAQNDLSIVVNMAEKLNKHVLIMAGGNWCSWCLRFNELITTDPQLDSIVKADYIVYHLNFSKENKNANTFAKYGFPQRFGFPVFIVLDQNGNRIHTQNSGLLEEGKGYSKDKVKEFFLQWNIKAISPDSYRN